MRLLFLLILPCIVMSWQIGKTSLIMNRFLLAIVTAFAAMSLASAQQKYNPTSTWPYAYPEFEDGVIYLDGGQKISRKMNVHLRAGRLHYLDGDIIKEADTSGAVAVYIGDDKYIFVNGEAMKVVAESRKGCVVQETLGDFASLAGGGGAYGSSSATLATRKLSSIETDSRINQSHMLLMQSKHDGAMLPLEEKYYIVTPAFTCVAAKVAVADALGPEKKAGWKEWLKSNKIRWRDPDSILKVTEYL